MRPFTHLAESLSASKIGAFLRCPLRYYFSYVERRPWEHAPAAMLLGQAVDVAIKNAVVAIQQGNDSVTSQEFFLEAYENAVEQARSPIRWPARFNREKLSDMGERLVSALEPILLAEDRVKRIVAHDVAFTIPLLDENGEPIFDTPLVGIFDFVEEIEGKRVPLELKTSATRTAYLPDALRRDPQALIYAMAAQALQSDGDAHVRYVAAVKLKTPEVVESDFHVDTEQLAWARMLIVGTKNAIDAGNFYPTPSVMTCGGCQFANACAKSSGSIKKSPKRIFAKTPLPAS